MAYALLFSSVFLISPLFQKQNKKRFSKYNYIFYVIAILFLSLFVGLRGIGVGSDTATYYYHFNSCGTMTVSQLFSRYKSDVGFYLFTWFFSRAFHSFNFYLWICSLIYLIPIGVLICKKSKSPLYSFFIFFCFGLFTFCLSTIRQSLAIGLCVSAYLFFEDKKRLLCVAFIALAALFHYSALVFLPVLLFRVIKVNKFFISLSFVLLAVSYFAAPNLLSLFNAIAERGSYSEYQSASVGGIGMILFLLFIYIISIITGHKSKEFEKNKNETLFIFFALLIFTISRSNLALMRLYYYFLIFLVICIPNILLKINDQGLRNVINLIVIFISIYFLIFEVFDGANEVSKLLLPYVPFWEN